MATVTGIKEVKEAIKSLKRNFRAEPVVVGYTANYALMVHENRSANFNVGKAGFLLDNTNEMKGELASIVKQTTKNNGSLQSGLDTAGLALQRKAQGDTPIDTGALRASAFTARESKANSAAAQAFIKSQEKRESALAVRAKKKAKKKGGK